MSRSRNIKPGFFTNDQLADCEPLARILFAGLWCEADRAGRLEDRPKKIKVAVLPYDECDVDSLLNQLSDHGLIDRYEVNGSRYIAVIEFAKHQNPHIREPASTIPAPCKHSASTVQEQNEHDSGPADSGFLIPDSIEEPLSADKPLTAVSEKQASRQERLSQVTDEAIAAYNATLAKPAGLLSKVTKVGRDKRRQQVERCVKVAREICQEEYGSERIVPEFWTAYFTACAQDDFLAGRGPYTNGHENWRPDFKHLTKSETLLKVYDRTAGDSAE